jgi:hypothetical protein
MDWDSLNDHVIQSQISDKVPVIDGNFEPLGWDWRSVGPPLVGTGCAVIVAALVIVASLQLQSKKNLKETQIITESHSSNTAATPPNSFQPASSCQDCGDLSSRPAQRHLSAISADCTSADVTKPIQSADSLPTVRDMSGSACVSSSLPSDEGPVWQELQKPLCKKALEGLPMPSTGTPEESVHAILFRLLDADPGQVTKEDYNFVLRVLNKLVVSCQQEAHNAIAALHVVSGTFEKALQVNMAHVRTSAVAEQRAVLARRRSIEDAEV